MVYHILLDSDWNKERKSPSIKSLGEVQAFQVGPLMILVTWVNHPEGACGQCMYEIQTSFTYAMGLCPIHPCPVENNGFK